MSIKPREIDHVVLRVSDVPRAIHFYCDVIGCVEERRRDDLGLIQLRAGRSLIDLVDVNGEIGKKGGPAPGRKGHNMDHLCVRVDPFDEPAIRKHLKDHGIKAGPTETRYGAEGNGPSIYLQDPDGNTVELKGPPE
ncbi:MAG: VOC family protein [Gammaproteobacteria bacterium]|nr:VOC family protein [Gammaproteobacteria bacterium]MDH3413848.1 VOC family protein [Gammaproteobacteria bacterium]